MTKNTALILLPRLQVQNINAISGPLSWGFPSPTAFIGFMHALERKFSSQLPAGFGGVGIVCHRFNPQIAEYDGHFKYCLCLRRAPVRKDEKPASIVEEGRAHMEISLIIAVKGYMSADNGKYLSSDLLEAAQSMRLAGGSLFRNAMANAMKPNGGHWQMTKTARQKGFASYAG